MENVNQVIQWLENHVNASVVITKLEDGDQDQVNLHLDKVSVGHLREKDPDEYVAKEAILLQGEGMIQSGGHTASLPLDAYEIPITDQMKASVDSNRLQIVTERAKYSLQIVK